MWLTLPSRHTADIRTPQERGVPPLLRNRGITLVEMLIAMAITLVMMAAVVTIFANVSGSVQKRRALIEMNGQLRHARNVMQRDLAGATCPTLPWQRPESNHGYLEITEGAYSDTFPSLLTDGIDDPSAGNGELDPGLSVVPRYNDGTLVQRDGNNVKSTLNGLGDYDDILALTTRNEEEPFVGRVPFTTVNPDGSTVVGSCRRSSTDVNSYSSLGSVALQSPLAEVVWFAVENPMDSADGFFGEPGLRTIYRRVLLIAPWITPYRYTDPNTGEVFDTYVDGGLLISTQPGLVRILPDSVDREHLSQAFAALIAFQERFDLSVRLEFNPRLGDDGRYQIVANTLSDLTKRENRFEHHYFTLGGATPSRMFPFALASTGSGYQGGQVRFQPDPELAGPGNAAQASPHFVNVAPLGRLVNAYSARPANYQNTNRQYSSRPFAYVDGNSNTPATARAILNDEGEVVHVVRGLVPLWGQRRGEDVMLTDALAFDLLAYDPGAPLFLDQRTETVIEPNDFAWVQAYRLHMPNNNAEIGTLPVSNIRFVGQGAYADLGYGFVPPPSSPLAVPVFNPSIVAVEPWFFTARALVDNLGNQLAPGYATYDTWSLHYENNGINEDGDAIESSGQEMVDEGTNGFDDFDPTVVGDPRLVESGDLALGGVDDVSERETTPPYDRPLRGLQVKLRLYERDSRQIREVSVKQHFVPD